MTAQLQGCRPATISPRPQRDSTGPAPSSVVFLGTPDPSGNEQTRKSRVGRDIKGWSPDYALGLSFAPGPGQLTAMGGQHSPPTRDRSLTPRVLYKACFCVSPNPRRTSLPNPRLLAIDSLTLEGRAGTRRLCVLSCPHSSPPPLSTSQGLDTAVDTGLRGSLAPAT